MSSSNKSENVVILSSSLVVNVDVSCLHFLLFSAIFLIYHFIISFFKNIYSLDCLDNNKKSNQNHFSILSLLVWILL
jgi:hypothetical protein